MSSPCSTRSAATAAPTSRLCLCPGSFGRSPCAGSGHCHAGARRDLLHAGVVGQVEACSADLRGARRGGSARPVGAPTPIPASANRARVRALDDSCWSRAGKLSRPAPPGFMSTILAVLDGTPQSVSGPCESQRGQAMLSADACPRPFPGHVDEESRECPDGRAWPGRSCSILWGGRCKSVPYCHRHAV